MRHFRYAILLILAAIPAAFGQATTSLRGTVNDPQGVAIDSAMVQLQGGQTGFRRSTLTDATGVYQFAQVPPGTYTVVL
jgi:protocatechuate 3,4-dioxygenase beta subunit